MCAHVFPKIVPGLPEMCYAILLYFTAASGFLMLEIKKQKMKKIITLKFAIKYLMLCFSPSSLSWHIFVSLTSARKVTPP